VAEARIVELTAKWLSRDKALSPQDVRKTLGDGGASAAEVDLFLAIVGDLGDRGTPSNVQ
jgi:hypothetical protein